MTTTEYAFPEELLDASIDEKYAFFADQMIRHPILDEVDTQLFGAIQRPCGYSLIQVYGPTGVGKTTLRTHISNEFIKRHMENREHNPGHIPLVSMEVVAPGKFSWKDFWRRLLKEADEPLIDYKKDLTLGGIRRNVDGKLIVRKTTTVADLRLAVEKCLKHRNLQALILDEAHHIGKVEPRRIQDQMDVLKSVANMTGTLLVLIGTYELLNLTTLSGQLSRRSLSIHFPRYAPNARGLRLFALCVNSLALKMPVKERPGLGDDIRYIYKGSMGCVGILKGWLERALWTALKEGASTVTRKHLEATIMRQRERLQIVKEIRYGEKVTRETDDTEGYLCQLLGIPECPEERDDKPRSKKQTRRPGERKPRRDKVGGRGMK